jgi:hypothetical protein
MLTVSRAAQARTLDQVEENALGGSEQMIHNGMAFVPRAHGLIR